MKKFIPDDDPVQTGGALKKKDDNIAASMLLTLAREGCYTESGEIKDANDIVVPETNVVRLIAYVCRPEPLVPGLVEFVSMLQRHGLNELPNENVSEVVKIRRRTRTAPPAAPRSPTPPAPTPPPRSPTPSPPTPPPPPPEVAVGIGRKRRWQSLDEPVGKRTRAGKKNKKS